MRRLLTGVLPGLLLGLLSLPAWASPAEDLASAREGLKSGDLARARSALKRAEAALEDADDVLPAKVVGQYFYYLAMIEFLEDGASDDAMDAFRQTLTVDLEAKWDMEIADDGASRDLFLALRNEVKDWPRHDAQVPEATGAARLYVDGVRLSAGDTVRDGVHLAQITCDDGSVQGTWADFSKKVKWFKLCPGGVDTSVVVVEEEPEDEFAEFGPMFGDDDPGGDDPTEAADPVATAVTTPTPGEGEEQVEIIPAWSRVKWPYVIAGAGAMALGGGLQLGAMNQNSSFYDLDNSELGSRESIESHRGRVNTMQTLALGSFVVGGGLFAVAVIPF